MVPYVVWQLEVVRTESKWKQPAVLAVLAFGILAGLVYGSHAAKRVPGAVSQQVKQEIFDAVYQWLDEAGVSRLDMPERIIEVTKIGPDRYRVHMKMVEGEGWFEVWKEDGTWQVRGLQPPEQEAGPGSRG